jgi:hypothetical protein
MKSRGWNRFCLEVGGWVWERDRKEVAQTMYIGISKCKNDKIKRRKKQNLKFSISGFHIFTVHCLLLSFLAFPCHPTLPESRIC